MSTWTRDGLPDFSGVDWRAMYEVASRERDEAERERDSWRERAESAEVQASQPEDTPTRAEVEETLQAATNSPSGWTLHGLTDAVWSLVSGPDPAVHVVRESDLPDVERNEDGWTDGTRHGWEGTSETAMECVETHLEWARFYTAAARAIEAGQVTDPVEDKARELARAGGIDFDEQEPAGVEMLIGMARHVLGGENAH